MSNGAKGFLYRDVTSHGRVETGHVVVNVGKVLPATATGNLFAVTGSVVVTGLVGVVSTLFAATAVKPTIGVTGLPAAIAAAPVAAYNATAVGSVIQMPLTSGGALPAPVVASGAAASAGIFVTIAANITITTDATNAGAVTWILYYQPLSPKFGATVTAV
jgi:hypothetical protein